MRALVYDTAAGAAAPGWRDEPGMDGSRPGVAAAEQSERPELVALQAYRLSYVIAGRRHPAEALELAMSVSAGLDRVMRGPDADTLSVYGALHLAGVHAAAALQDRARHVCRACSSGRGRSPPAPGTATGWGRRSGT